MSCFADKVSLWRYRNAAFHSVGKCCKSNQRFCGLATVNVTRRDSSSSQKLSTQTGIPSAQQKRGSSTPALAGDTGTTSSIDFENIDEDPQVRLNRLLNTAAIGTVAAVTGGWFLHAGTDPWATYQHAVAANPIETKACISGVIYSLGDLVAQTYEGRDIAEWDRGRILRSGICGLIAHGPLSHMYYLALDHAFAQQNFLTASWMVPVAKIAIDQTAWSLCWNSTYYTLLGILKFESPSIIISSVKNSWWDLLKAGWRLWPIVHIFTYGVIPIQHRLLFVDVVEILW